jgi:hypothetical protein
MKTNEAHTDTHADTRETKRSKRSRGGKPMIVVGRGHMLMTFAGIAKNARKGEVVKT